MHLRMLACVFFVSMVGSGAADERAAVEASAPALREEHFVLEVDAPAAGERAASRQRVGLAVLRRRNDAAGEQTELDLRFEREETRVLHVERWRIGAPRLVWREWRPGGGRTVVAEPLAEADVVRVVEWGSTECARLDVTARGGALLPLYFLELARRGEISSGSFPRFDPLSNSVERVTTAVAFAPCVEPGVVVRRFTLLRDVGTSAGSFVFEGDALREFRWQDGGLAARAVTREEYERLAGATDSSSPGDR